MCTSSPSLVRLCLAILTVSSWISSAAAQSPSVAGHVPIPPNLRVCAQLQSVVSELLDKSPTIRRQSEVIGRLSRVRVNLGLAGVVGGSHSRARGTIQHYEHGFLEAVITIPVGDDHAELIAHELEHVLEQIEGLDLAALAAQHASGVSRLADGAFETERARAAGIAAAKEVPVRADLAVSAGHGMTRAARAAWQALSGTRSGQDKR